MKPNTPVLMCSVPGYDASGHVEDLAAEQNTQITSIAIGNIFIYFVISNGCGRQVHSSDMVMLSF